MAVRVIQRNNGVQSGVEFIIPALPGETDAQTLTRKKNSHAAKGWTVTTQGQSRATASKTYPPGKWAQTKERVFRIA
jgi:hypothetical protein